MTEPTAVQGAEIDGGDKRPWTLPELSGGLEELAGRLEQTENHFGDALEKLSQALLALRGQLAPLLKRETEKDIDPRPWSARATPAQWAELFDWVDWIQAHYGTLPEFNIQPCWPAHIGMVEELAGLHQSWKRAQIVDELAGKAGSNDLAGWHDRWLWPFLQRAKGGHYRTTNCTDQHVTERITSKPTDRSHLPPGQSSRATRERDETTSPLLDNNYGD